MKMVMVVVPRNTADRVLDALVNAGYTATCAETTGGMLRQSQYSLFTAVQQEKLEDVLEIIRKNCRTQVEMGLQKSRDDKTMDPSPVTADLGGAIAFIWDIDRIETF